MDDAIFDFVPTVTANADAALYGRVTYEMMQAYWPTAGDKPHASKHDREHSSWYNSVAKIVLSRTLDEKGLVNTRVVKDHLREQITQIKQEGGKDIVIFGSPRAVNALMKEGLIDGFWLFVSPILLGKGKPLFEKQEKAISLTLIDTKTFSCGVVAMHYAVNSRGSSAP